MFDLEFEKVEIYDYSKKFLQDYEQRIKKVFCLLCQDDDKLSDDFKKYVQNFNNISVKLRPDYEYDIDAYMSFVQAEYSYQYKDTYESGSHLSGTLTVKDGKADASDVSLVKEYSTYLATDTGKVSFYSTAMKDCRMNVGTQSFSNCDISSCVKISDLKNANASLAKLVKEKMSNVTINPNVKFSRLPKHVHDQLMKSTGKPSNAKNFTIKIVDYRIEKCSIIYFPSACPFDICVNYKGVNYSQTGLKSTNELRSQGENSKHYDDFGEEVENLQQKYTADKWNGANSFYVAPFILSVIMFVGLAVILIFNNQFGHPRIGMNYLFEMLGLMAGALVLGILSMVAPGSCYKLPSVEHLYSSSKSITSLRGEVEKEFAGKKRAMIIIAGVVSSIFILLNGAIGYGGYSIYSLTDNPKPFYVTELVGEYVSAFAEQDTIWTINSCDENGNVVCDLQIVRNDLMYAKVKYAGKISSRDKDDKVEMRVDFVENLYNPKVNGSAYAPKEYYTLIFTENFSKLFDGYLYCSRTQNYYTTNYYRPEIIKKYYHHDVCMEITFCDEQGNVNISVTGKRFDTWDPLVTYTGKIVYRQNNGTTIIFVQTTDQVGYWFNGYGLTSDKYIGINDSASVLRFQKNSGTWRNVLYDVYSLQ